MISEGLQRTGYDEVSLTSLSTADFSGIEKVVADTVSDQGVGQVSVALPSLRVDAFTVGIAAELQRARRTGLTFALKPAPGACVRSSTSSSVKKTSTAPSNRPTARAGVA